MAYPHSFRRRPVATCPRYRRVPFAVFAALATLVALGLPAPASARAPAQSRPLDPDAMQEPRVDEGYGERIREFTTEDFFLTPLVDHVPASDDVPTPLDALGTVSGAPDVLHYPEEIHGYLRAVADASPRVEVFSMGETEEGREQVLVVVADEETLARLEEHKAMLRRLGDPRETSPEEAERILTEVKPVYWATGAIHSPETGSPEMLMELVYRLATGESEFIRAIRDNLIFMATPVVEVDGRAKVVDLHMAEHRGVELELPGRPLYWGQYVAHDNNRDNIGLALQLSKNVVRTFLDYRPTVMHDLHESASYLYTSTGRGPYNAWLDPVVINEWNRLAYKEVKDMTALGVPGVYTFDFYDGWGANYMIWVAHMRNGIGRFYETQGARDASNYVVRSGAEREWHRPSVPLDEVVWGIRNNVNLQQSALLIALHEVATNREEFLRSYRLKAERSVAKASAEGPAAYVFPAGDRRPGQQARLLRLMQEHGFEVHRLEEELVIAEEEEEEVEDPGAEPSTPGAASGEAEDTEDAETHTFPAGSYVIRMDQPFSRGADMLLDKQYYNPDDPRPYDDVGWTVGPLFGAGTVRIENPAVLDAPMEPVRVPVREGGEVRGGGSHWIIAYDADNEMASFRYAHPGLRIEAAETAFELDGTAFPVGSWIVPASDDPADVRATLEVAAERYGFTAHGTDAPPSVPTHPVSSPRVAVVHTWQSTQDEGWLRVGLDEYGIPYDYVSVHEIRDTPRLMDRWDVILMGPASSNALSIVNGLDGDEPIVWMPTEATPNIGRQDSTADMRGGVELEGVLHLKRFVEEGGVFVTLTSSSSLPVHFGLAEGVRIVERPELWAEGGVFRVERRDATHPLAYGFGPELGVAFDGDPIFATGGGGFGGFGGGDLRGGPGSTTDRRTGRGGAGEEDIVQGRPRDWGDHGVEEFEAREEEEGDDEDDEDGDDEEPTVRTVLAFAGDPQEVLISGGVRNPAQLAGAPALIDVRRGEGHIVLFGFNPFWRSHTHGSYALVFNALLHYGHYRGAQPVATEEDAGGG